MKILISSASYIYSDFYAGGEQQIAYSITSGLASRGHEIFVISPLVKLSRDLPNVQAIEVGGYDFFSTYSYSEYLWKWWEFATLSCLKAREVCQKHNIDIIHHIRPAFPKKFSLCWKLQAPLIYGPLSLPLPGKFNRRKWTFKSAKEKLRSKMVDRLEMMLGSCLWRKTLEKASFIPISVEPTLKYIPKKLHSRSPIIPLGVDCDVFKPNRYPANGNEIKLLFVGKVEEHKGIKELLEAFRMVLDKKHNISLTILGEVKDRTYVENKIKYLKIENRVELIGRVPFEKTVDYFQSCDIFCLPSKFEAFGLSILQAMSCGKPIVTTRVGGIPSFVKDGRSGFLVPSENSNTLALSILELIKNPELRYEMGLYNSKLCKNKYDWKKIVGQVEDMYIEAVAQNKRKDHKF
jgi:glycosyltransferase involved in cell wall biosynthesis